MDESHLIAPTVHGNTADLPTALASIIGLAGMETRIDHERPGWLGTWLQDRCHQGLGVPEAECLCLRMYYRFDGIPMALRPQLSRVTLASTFAELARRGWIRTANGAAGDDLLTPQYWQQLLTPNYHRSGPIYDYALGEAAFHRLQLGLG